MALKRPNDGSLPESKEPRNEKQDLLEKAKRQIEAFKAARGLANAPAGGPPPVHGPPLAVPPPVAPSFRAPAPVPAPVAPTVDISSLAAQVQMRLNAMKQGQAGIPRPPVLPFPGADGIMTPSPMEKKESGPRVVRMDDQGRMFDAEGREIKLEKRAPELRANLRQKPTDASDAREAGPGASNPYFDARLQLTNTERSKRQFNFVEQGKYEQLADRLQTKAKLALLQQEIAETAKKTGITSATRLALIAPKRVLGVTEIPDIEWWDIEVLPSKSYEEMDFSTLANITHLIQHPIPIEPAAAKKEGLSEPLMLTKEERKKMRRQRRMAEEKERQEKIKLGLLDAPAPKVKISNLMRVLGVEAVQDPTKIEAIVRTQMTMRKEKHETSNKDRALTADQKREKTIRKLKEDTSLQAHVCVFRISSLSNAAYKFKVEKNAKDLFLTGCALLQKELAIVVVEGGPKGIKKYKHLMLDRVKWAEDDTQETPNSCALVWEGVVSNRNFKNFECKNFQHEMLAREHLARYGVAHYWDACVAEALLEQQNEALRL